MMKMLIGAGALALLLAGAANAQAYDGRPPYAVGGYGYGDGGCRFTLAGAHAGVTLLGIDLSGGARLSLPSDCEGAGPAAYAQPYAQPYPEPAPYYAAQPYGYQGGGYPPPMAYSQPPAYPMPSYGYPAAPCGCQPMGYGGYQPY